MATSKRHCRCGTELAADNTGSLCSTCQRSARADGPPEVPAEFWHEPRVVEALSARHIGRLIRAWRTHPYHGRTIAQDRAARWLATTQSQLSRIETGPAIMQLDRLSFWASVIGAPAELLWFTPSPAGQAVAGERQAPDDQRLAAEQLVVIDDQWSALHTVELLDELTTEEFTVNRREMMRGLAGMVVGSTLLDRMEPWLATSRPGPDRERSTIGVDEVDHLEVAARAFREWDHRQGGGLRRKAVIGQLNALTEELRRFSHPPELARRMFNVMAELAECAATMSLGLRPRPTGPALLHRRPQSSEGGGQPRVRGQRARWHGPSAVLPRPPADGLELVRLAQAGLPGDVTPEVRSMLLTREAWGYAKQRRLGAFRRITSQAEDALRDADARLDVPHWIAYYDQSELAGTTGGRLLELAHVDPSLGGPAADLIDDAVQLRPDGALRCSALDHIGLAEARLVQREIAEAVRLGHQAADVAEQTQSDRARVKLEEFNDLAAAYASLQPVADLRDRLDRILQLA